VHSARATSLHITGRHGTDIAVHLRDDQIRMQRLNQICVDAVKRITGTQTAPDFGIDLPTRDRYVKCSIAAAWKSPNPGWVVTLMGTTNEHLTATQSTDYLCGARQKRNYAHLELLSIVSIKATTESSWLDTGSLFTTFLWLWKTIAPMII